MGENSNPNIAEERKSHRWKKGQSGNPSGRPKSKTLSNADRNKLEEPLPNDPEGRTWAELMAEKSLIGQKGKRVNPSNLKTRR
jgi:hypothetical protein